MPIASGLKRGVFAPLHHNSLFFDPPTPGISSPCAHHNFFSACESAKWG